MRKPSCLVALALILAFSSGCSPRRAPVSGKVTIDGKEPGVSGILVSFLGSDGQAATAEVGKDGAFLVPGVLVGENKVGFRWVPPAGPEQLGPNATDEEKMAARRKKGEGVRTAGPGPIPTRYNDPIASGLTFNVEPGEGNKYTTDLKK